MRIFSANWGTGAGSGYPFERMGSVVAVDNAKELKAHAPVKGDILIIWGGADIHPSIYHRPNIASYVGDAPSIRDITEVALMEAAVKLDIMTLGVCRGAQLACALAGGVLAQDVEHHGWEHDITIINSVQKLKTSSVHHQMMVPFRVPHELIAVSSEKLSRHYSGLENDERQVLEEIGEPEIVWFPEKRFLAVQGHPEFMDENCKFNYYIRDLVDQYREVA